MKTLLVGGTAFVGRHLLRALCNAGHYLLATSREPQVPGWPGVEWRQLGLILAWPSAKNGY